MYTCKCSFIFCSFPQENTYQLVLIIDALNFRTVTLYTYVDIGWDSTDYIRKSMIGYFVLKDTAESSMTVAYSNTESAFKLTQFVGNTGGIIEPQRFYPNHEQKSIRTFGIPSFAGLNGMWSIVLSSGELTINYNQMCSNWYHTSLNDLSSLVSQFNTTSACPCDITTANTDTRWYYDSSLTTGTSLKCYYERTPSVTATQVSRADGTKDCFDEYCNFSPLHSL